jgi:citrate lyase subunit beta/citryl-CoA lyase
VRVNPLELDGMDDLAAVMRGRPDIVALAKVAEPHHVVRLDEAVSRFEREYGIGEGTTALLPNIEFARGLVQIGAIAAASRRTVGLLLASEDLAADLGAERGPDGLELAYCRQRFIVECRAADVVAVDCPYTFSDAEGVARDTRSRGGWDMSPRAWSIPAHAADRQRRADTFRRGVCVVPAQSLRPSRRRAQKGSGRVELDGALVEVPTCSNAKRLIARAEALAEFAR